MSAKGLLISAASVILLTACGTETVDQPPENEAAADTAVTDAGAKTADSSATTEIASATPPAGFAQCRTCHTYEKDGKNGIGPNLWGVAGQPAGHLDGFNYSPAMKSSGLTWDTATLDRYLKEPLKVVRGTKMAYAGLRNDEQRAEVVAFLESLKD